MFMRKTILCAVLLAALLNFYCDKNTSSPDPGNNLTDFTGEYLSQEPPGQEAKRFAEDLLLASSGWCWHGPPVFSPDGTELYFSKLVNTDPSRIIIQSMKIKNGRWTRPAYPTFASEDRCNNPMFAENGNRLYFISRNQGGLLFVNRIENGWSQPVRVDITIPSSLSAGWQFAITGDKTIYAELWDENGPDLYRFKYTGNTYQEPENLGEAINTEYTEFAPVLAPDESYLIFSSNRPGGFGMHDLYISFWEKNGNWTEPKNMGHKINSTHEDAGPMISPDGKYFFFTSLRGNDQGYNPYWINIQIIDELK